MSSDLKRVGLTGGVGAGKSSVAKLLERAGVPVVDMDRLGREVTEADLTVVSRLAELTGLPLTPEGKLDRPAMRKALFGDATLKRKVEEYLHPIIRQRFAERCETFRSAGKRLVICEAALLIETGFGRQLDELIVVLASEASRKKRLIARDSVSEALAEQMLAAQVSDLQRREAATHLIHNDGDVSELEGQVAALLSRWRNKGWL